MVVVVIVVVAVIIHTPSAAEMIKSESSLENEIWTFAAPVFKTRIGFEKENEWKMKAQEAKYSNK